MTNIIDYAAKRRAREEQQRATKARTQLRLVASAVAASISEGLPGADEARAICDRALGEENHLTEDAIFDIIKGGSNV